MSIGINDKEDTILKPKSGDIYLHFKGNEYRIIGMGTHSETLEELVLYETVKAPGRIWVRPLDNFMEIVTLPTGVTAQRFVRVYN